MLNIDAARAKREAGDLQEEPPVENDFKRVMDGISARAAREKAKREAHSEPEPASPALAAPVSHVAKPKAATRALTDPVNVFGFPDVAGNDNHPLNTVENLTYIMSEYGISARHNIMRKKTELAIPNFVAAPDIFDSAALAELTSVCARNRMPQTMLADYVKRIAANNQYNPVCDWITSKPWDGVERVQQLLDTVKVQDGYPVAMRDALIYRWLLSAVAAAFKPSGFTSHGVLVFVGDQGLGKTSWVKALVPGDIGAVLEGAILDPANKDHVVNCVSHWIVELGELNATFKKADIERLKAFVTQAVDKLRRPYDRVESEYQRRTVFFGSVNEGRYLVDDTGNRRWHTVAVQSIDYRHGIDMQQVWAELLMHYQRGEQWWLTDEEQKALNAINEGHEQSDPIAELILASFDPSVPEWKHMQASEVLRAIGYSQPTSGQASKAGKALAKLGFRKSKYEGRQGFWMPRSGNDRWHPGEDDRPI